MAKCINTSHPDFVKLLNSYSGSMLELELEVFEYQAYTGNDDFPSIEDLNSFNNKDQNTSSINQDNKELNDKLYVWLNNLGVKTTSLESYKNSYFEKYNEEITPIAIADSANMVIAVNEDRIKEDTLPEEVAHFAIWGLGKDHTLINKVLSNIDKTDIYKEIFEKYIKVYKGDVEKVKLEAAGKLLSKAVLRKDKEIRASLTDKLINWLTKVWDLFKTKFLGSKPSLDKIIIESFGELASQILLGNVDNIDRSKIKNESGLMYQLDESLFYDEVNKTQTSTALNHLEKTLTKALTSLGNKVQILKQEKKAEALAFREESKLRELILAKDKGETTYALVKFINKASANAEQLLTKFNDIKENIEKKPIDEVAKDLRTMKNYVNVYKPIIDTLQSEVLLMKDVLSEGMIGASGIKEIKEELFETSKILNALDNGYKKLALKSFIEKFKGFDFLPPKYRNNEENLEQLLEEADRDISIVSRWVNAMGDTNDDLLKIMDRYIKESQETARLESEEDIKMLINLDEELKKAGIKDTDWMYEKDNSGNPTGNIVQYKNYGKFNIAKTKFFADLDSNYFSKAGLTEEEKNIEMLDWDMTKYKAYQKEIAEWFDANSQPLPDVDSVIIKRVEEIYNRFVPKSERNQDNLNRLKVEVQKSGNKINKLPAKDFSSREITALEEIINWLNSVRIESEFRLKLRGEAYIYKGELSEPSDKYTNDNYISISKNYHKKRYYDFVISKKDSLEKYMSSSIAPGMLAPQVRKDWFERLVKKDDKGGFIKESFTDAFTRREDDVEYGVATDAKNRELEFVPLFYTKRISNKDGTYAYDDLSLDFTSSFAAYIHQAHKYNKMVDIVDYVEIGRDIINDRDIPTGRKTMLGKLNNFFSDTKAYQEVKGGNIAQLYNDAVSMQVYGKLKKDQGTVLGNLDAAKVGDAVGKLTAINTLAFNVYAGMANSILANALQIQESIASEYASKGDYVKASAFYYKHLPSLLGDTGRNKSNNLVRLLAEKFDILQDFRTSISNLESDRSRFSRLFNTSSLFFLNHAGEHQAQITMGLSMLYNEKVLIDGKEDSLINAFIAKDGILVLKDNVTDLSNNKIDNKYLSRLSLKIKKVNQRLHGIYNDEDKSAIQRGVLGRLAIMYRKWIVPGFNRRFQSPTYDVILEQDLEGTYYSAMRFLRHLYADIKQGQYSLTHSWNELTDHQKANMVRNFVEAGYMLSASILASILINLKEDDDEDNFALNMTAIQVNRFVTEMSFFYNPKEFKRLLQQPAVAINTAEGLTSLLQFWDIKEVKKGAKATIPFYRNIDNLTRSNDILRFYADN